MSIFRSPLNREAGGFLTRLSHSPLSGQSEGERRKSDALATLEARREIYVRRGRRALLETLLLGGNAIADDVRMLVELPPEIDPRCFGAVPGLLARAGIIRQAGFMKSNRPERHASYIQVWELADRSKAMQWLVDHPDLEDRFEVAASQRLLFPTNTTNEPTPTAATIGAGME